jgi:hypothetical protein
MKSTKYFSVQVFWIVTPCSVAVGHQRFLGSRCIHLEGSSKVLRKVNFLPQYATLRHKAEGLDMSSHRREKLKSTFVMSIHEQVRAPKLRRT